MPDRTMWRDKLLSLLGRAVSGEKSRRRSKFSMSEQARDFLQYLLAEAGYQVTAVDYTEEMLKEAQQQCRWTGRVYCVENW